MTANPQEQAEELQNPLVAYAEQQQWLYERQRRAWADEIGRPYPQREDA